jgi:hypothetical protein
MALMPGTVQKPVSAHGGPTGAILGVVIHVTAGEGDPYNEFANPNNKVSSHFGIGNGQGGMADGVIEQYVDTSLMAWAEVNGNANYISVETEGEPNEPLTNNQILAFASVMVWAHRTYSVPLVSVDVPGQLGFITHGDGGVSWGNHPDCPGPARSAQRAAILFIADLIVNPPPPPPQEEDMPLYATNSAGTGFVIAADLSSKTGILDGTDAGALIATGLYKSVKLSDAQINSIPNAS